MRKIDMETVKFENEPDLSFEVWFLENEDDLATEAAERGLDREGDFDFESWAEARFEKLNK